MLGPLVMWGGQRRAVFYNWGPAIPFPYVSRAQTEDVWIETDDRLRLHGWYAACPETEPKYFGDERLAVLFFHGNAGSLPRWRWVADRWQQGLGADVLLIDYRGYGRSEGSPSERGLCADARAAYRWLRDVKQIPAERIVIVGQSLGGGVAASLACEVECRGLVLESTFTSTADVAVDQAWGVPIGSLVWDRFESLRRLTGYAGPVFLSHGDADGLIHHRHAQMLQRVLTGPTELLLIPRMGHTDSRPQDYPGRVREFLQQHPFPKPPARSG